MTTIRRWSARALAVLLSLALTLPALAYERVDTGKAVRFTLDYQDTERENLPISGMKLQLYKIADMTDAARFTVTEAFRPAGVDLASGTDWAAKAATLAAFAALHRENLTFAASGSTDSAGAFAAGELSVGLYLVTGEPVTLGDYTYTPVPFLITLPMLDEETDAWQYEVSAKGKFTRTYHGGNGGGGDSDTSRSVRKVWAGDEEASRPASVTVCLLKNGKAYDTVELSADNDWRYSWTGLEDSASWSLTETDVPEGYTVLVEQSGRTFVVTNTRENPSQEEPPGAPPSGQTPPGEHPPGGGGPTPAPPEKLPQTGVLWWPVQALTVIGLLLFSAGWLGGRKERHEET